MSFFLFNLGVICIITGILLALGGDDDMDLLA